MKGREIRRRITHHPLATLRQVVHYRNGGHAAMVTAPRELTAMLQEVAA